jgi:protoheme IX farnesyltransferase
MSRLFRLAALSAAAIVALIVLGGLSRLQTGPGCADWPRCGLAWSPSLEPSLLVDWLHRAVSASLGLLLLATAVVAWLTPEASPRTRRVAWTGVGLVVVQSVVGAFTVGVTPAWAGTLHLALALVMLATALLAALSVADDGGALANSPLGDGRAIVAVRRSALVGVAIIFLLILSGAASNAAGVTVACTSWPLCPDGGVDAGAVSTVSIAGFQLTAFASAMVALAVGWSAWRRPTDRRIRLLAAGAVGLAIVQGLAGAGAVATGRPEWVGPLALATLTPLWVLMVAMAVLCGTSSPALAGLSVAGGTETTIRLVGGNWGISGFGFSQWRRTITDYVALTKPGIMTLLLTTTLGAMLVAEAGLPPFWLVAATLLGGVLAAGGANALNCFVDRDIDAQMTRTRDRASAAGRISPAAVLAFGLTLTVVAVIELWTLVNPLAALLALAGNLFYVLVYTYWLKRRTPQNIVIGGAAGAVPPLVGWAAVTGDLSILAWGLFGVIFLWTPPHFWALALLKQGEYGRVGVPMLPNVAGEAETRKQVLIYTGLLALLCIALTPFGLGWIYLLGALAVNAVFLVYALRLFLAPSKATARGMFFFSLWYLALVFGAAVVDRLLLG